MTIEDEIIEQEKRRQAIRDSLELTFIRGDVLYKKIEPSKERIESEKRQKRKEELERTSLDVQEYFWLRYLVAMENYPSVGNPMSKEKFWKKNKWKTVPR